MRLFVSLNNPYLCLEEFSYHKRDHSQTFKTLHIHPSFRSSSLGLASRRNISWEYLFVMRSHDMTWLVTLVGHTTFSPYVSTLCVRLGHYCLSATLSHMTSYMCAHPVSDMCYYLLLLSCHLSFTPLGYVSGYNHAYDFLSNRRFVFFIPRLKGCCSRDRHFKSLES